MKISVVVGVVVALMTLPSVGFADGVITEPATGAAVSAAAPMLASSPVTGGSTIPYVRWAALLSRGIRRGPSSFKEIRICAT